MFWICSDGNTKILVGSRPPKGLFLFFFSFVRIRYSFQKENRTFFSLISKQTACLGLSFKRYRAILSKAGFKWLDKDEVCQNKVWNKLSGKLKMNFFLF